MKDRSFPAQQGNALLIVLIGVALFAALAFAISSSRTSVVGATTKEKARVIATEMIQYGDAVGSTVNKLLLVGGAKFTGSSDTSPSFYTTGVSTDYQTGGPANFEVFSMSGGGLAHQDPPQGACLSSCAYDFTAGVYLKGIGDDGKDDLAMVVRDVDPQVCTMINEVQKNGWSSTPSGDQFPLEVFSGINFCDVGGCGETHYFTGDAAFDRKKSFCYQEAGGAQRYVFVHVVRSR